MGIKLRGSKNQPLVRFFSSDDDGGAKKMNQASII